MPSPRLPATALLGLLLVLAPGADAAAQPAGVPVSITGQVLEYNSQTGVVTARGAARLTYADVVLAADLIEVNLRTLDLRAEGGVRLTSEQGTLVAEALTWNLRRREGALRQGRTIVGGVYVGAQQVEASPSRTLAYNAFFTTCSPDRPLYSITAARIEIYPGDRLVAVGATLWLGRVRIATLRSLTVSLRPRGEPAEFLPRAGSNGTDGVWVGLTRRYDVGPVVGQFDLRVTTLNGVFLLNTLRYPTPAFQIGLVAGRTESLDPVTGRFRPYLVAAAGVATPPRALGPLRYAFDASAGWFRDQTFGAAGTRLRLGATLGVERIALADRLSFGAGWTVALQAYGTGQRYLTSEAGASLVYDLAPGRSIGLVYVHALPWGATPFAFDSLTPRHEVRLRYQVTTPRVEFGIAPGYDLLRSEIDLVTGLSAPLGGRVRIGILADYNLTRRRFDDLDVSIRTRCDCLQVGLTWRAVRRQVLFEISFTTVFGPESEP